MNPYRETDEHSPVEALSPHSRMPPVGEEADEVGGGPSCRVSNLLRNRGSGFRGWEGSSFPGQMPCEDVGLGPIC